MKSIATVVAAAALVAACGEGTTPPPPPPPPPPSTLDVTTGAQPPARFIPVLGTVAVGGTVTFTNGSPVEHNVTTGTGAWDAETLAPEESFSVTFPTAGTFNYQCTVHPGMTGTITVE